MRSSTGQPITLQSFGRDGELRIYAKPRFRLLRRIHLWSHRDSGRITRHSEVILPVRSARSESYDTVQKSRCGKLQVRQ